MTIKTKYNIGDEVWFIDSNLCYCGTIIGYRYSYGVGHWYGGYKGGEAVTKVYYCIEVKHPSKSIKPDIAETRLFPTKEELLNSL